MSARTIIRIDVTSNVTLAEVSEVSSFRAAG